jgi:ribonuclease P protein component
MNNPSDFSRVFRRAKRVSQGGLTVLTIENSVGHPRLGLAVAKKHLKLASRRNRLKRIIRAAFQQKQSEFANIDIVVLTRPSVGQCDAPQIWESLDKLWGVVITQWQKS